jgi:penicillin-binding protein 1A
MGREYRRVNAWDTEVPAPCRGTRHEKEHQALPTTTRTRNRLLSNLVAWLFAGLPVLLTCGLGAGLAGSLLGAYLYYSADLPSIPDLRAYRPKTVSTFYAEDGTVIGVFYEQKRFPVPIDSMGSHVIKAFLAAEDARFFSHPGIDLIGVGRAIIKNIETRDYSEGASTITQQVTRHFLLSREKKIRRKIREAILAYRLEKTLTKKEILGLYLNEIYLGRGAYGVEAAARSYFGKTNTDLTIAEAALLAGLVANPGAFSPHRDLKAALRRREFVLERMLVNGFITPAQHQAASKETVRLREKLPNPYERAPYFTEAVRQYILDRYGEERLYNEGLKVWTTCDLAMQAKAKEALIEGAQDWEERHRRPRGLVERLEPGQVRQFLQARAADGFQEGDVVQALVVKNHTPARKRSRKKRSSDEETHLQDCTLALKGDVRFRMELESKRRYRTNDLLEFRISEVEEKTAQLVQQTLPPVQGAVVCIENRSGCVRALVGGLDFQRSKFNRAMQAMRQPGSAFKPFVYTAALEWNRYTPYSTVVDEPFAVLVNTDEEPWVPANSDREFSGSITLRDALVLSRNTATVKLMMDVGIDGAIRMSRNLGIQSPLGRNISLALGAAEVTPLELTGAYTVFPNLGTRVEPVLVKKVTDRYGNILEDHTAEAIDISLASLSEPEATAWLKLRSTPTQQPAPTGPNPYYEAASYQPVQGPLPEENLYPSDLPLTEADRASTVEAVLALPLSLNGGNVFRREAPRRVLSPQSAYLMVSMLREVCVSGTAAKVNRLKRGDLAGKTGTTDNCSDAWFVGFNPTYTTGVWVGYDTKKSLGKKEYGSKAALPVWMDFMESILKDKPETGYLPPPGIVFWDRQTAQSNNLARMLRANPDLDPRLERKEIIPLDEQQTYFASYPSVGPSGPVMEDPEFPGFSVPGDQAWLADPYGQYASGSYTPMPYGGTLRLLTVDGQSLGRIPYSLDEEGSFVLPEEIIIDENQTASYSYPSTTGSPYPRNGYPPAAGGPSHQAEAEPDFFDQPPDAPVSPDNGMGALLPRAARFLRNIPNYLFPETPSGWGP